MWDDGDGLEPCNTTANVKQCVYLIEFSSEHHAFTINAYCLQGKHLDNVEIFIAEGEMALVNQDLTTFHLQEGFVWEIHVVLAAFDAQIHKEVW